jgi:Putative stress-induced transcription regulator
VEIQELVELGDDPALSFLNSGIASGRHATELLADGASYLDWLERAGLLEAGSRETVAGRFGPLELDAVAAEAVELREWLRPVVSAWAAAAERTVPTGVRERLNAVLAVDHRYLSIEPLMGDDSAVAAVVERRHWETAGQLLVPPAAAGGTNN